VIAWFWSYAPALIGDDFRPLSGPDPGDPAYGILLVSRLPVERVEHLRFPRPAAVNSAPRCWAPSRWGRARSRVGDLNMPSTVLLLASRQGWPETGHGRTFPNSAPTQQLDHGLRNDPAGVVRPLGSRVAAAPVSEHRALVVELDITTS